MSAFQFRYFSVKQERSAMKVGTDAMILGAFIDATLKQRGLDIGSGTGVLSMMTAQKNESLYIDAIELIAEAVAEATENFSLSPFSERIKAYHQDILLFTPDYKYDLIFSNPPFFDSSLKSPEQNRNMARHTDSLPFEALFEKVEELLDVNGDFWLILPVDRMKEVYLYADQMKLHLKKEICIYGKPSHHIRTIAVFSKIPGFMQRSGFTVRNSDGSYTEEYKALTIDFHSRAL